MERKTGQEIEREALIKDIFARPIVIGLEGGPCGGKTSVIEALKTVKSERPIVILPEAATIIAGQYEAAGVDIHKKIKSDSFARTRFETEILGLTLNQIQRARQQYHGTGAVIVADRVDIGGYTEENERHWIHKTLGFRHPPFITLVDKILYFPTLARKNPDAYQELRSTNPARKETVEEAVEVCESVFKSVINHPEMHYMELGCFEESLNAAMEYVLHPEQEHEVGGFTDKETANKFIDYKITENRFYGTTNIHQSYHKFGDTEYRLRSESMLDNMIPARYSISLKDAQTSTERQRLITKQEFRLLDVNAEAELNKRRDRFLHCDDATGITDIWCLDEIELRPGESIWIFEVERHSAKALEGLRLPFENYTPKFCTNRQLAELALMFS